ncbi:DMT family transporter [Candidatus Fermentibacteria bacterium]|nr:DMT family transporter [Candidatus Fermentibacteria bacterium]
MKNSTKAALFLSLGTAMWGSTFLVIKTLLDAMSTGVLLCLRFGVSSAVLLTTAVLARPVKDGPAPLPFGKLLKPSLLIGLSLLGGYAFQTAGLQYTGPGKSAFITSLYVAFTPFAAWPINGRKPLPVHFLSVGAALLVVYLLSDPSGPLNLGDALTAVSAVFWALEIALIDRLFVKGSDLRITAMMLAVVAIGSVPLIPLLGGTRLEPGPAPALAMLYLAIPATSMLMYWQIRWQPSLGGSLSSLIYIGEAVVAAAGGAAFFGERFPLTGWIGSTLIVCSILIAFGTERRAA